MADSFADAEVPGEEGAGQGSWWDAPVVYPGLYGWLLLLSVLDVLMTYGVLRLGGSESNPLAAWVLRRADIAGMVVYKFVIIAGVVVLCEVVGRRAFGTGRKLAVALVLLATVPVVWGGLLILRHQM